MLASVSTNFFNCLKSSMHKSDVFTFGFLASSIVMLAIMPLFNQNNFPNVRGQEYGAYDDYNDDMYSKYPTEVNKYECRTGPFEGFFVSSVEFCKFNKFKFDDRKDNNRDNRTGTPGSAGPQVQQVHKEFKDQKVTLEQLDHRVFKEIQVKQVLLV